MISNEREHFLVIHEVLLPETARHQQHVLLGRLRDTQLRSQDQPLHVSHRIPCFHDHLDSGIWNTRQHLEGACKVALVHPGKDQATDGKVFVMLNVVTCFSSSVRVVIFFSSYQASRALNIKMSRTRNSGNCVSGNKSG